MTISKLNHPINLCFYFQVCISLTPLLSEEFQLRSLFFARFHLRPQEAHQTVFELQLKNLFLFLPINIHPDLLRSFYSCLFCLRRTFFESNGTESCDEISQALFLFYGNQFLCEPSGDLLGIVGLFLKKNT